MVPGANTSRGNRSPCAYCARPSDGTAVAGRCHRFGDLWRGGRPDAGRLRCCVRRLCNLRPRACAVVRRLCPPSLAGTLGCRPATTAASIGARSPGRCNRLILSVGAGLGVGSILTRPRRVGFPCATYRAGRRRTSQRHGLRCAPQNGGLAAARAMGSGMDRLLHGGSAGSDVASPGPGRDHQHHTGCRDASRHTRSNMARPLRPEPQPRSAGCTFGRLPSELNRVIEDSSPTPLT